MITQNIFLLISKFTTMGLKRWTQEEDNLLIQELSKTPDNLDYAFRKLSCKIDRSYNAINNRWYYKLKKEDTVIAIGSSKGILPNTKNTPKPKDNTKKALIIELMSYLSPQDRRDVFMEMFKSL